MEPRIVELEPMTIAFISMQGPYSEIPKCFAMLYDYVTENGWTPCGPPHGVYLTKPGETPEDQARWELWAPIAEEEAERGPDKLGLGIRRLDRRTMIAGLHVGPYEKLHETYQPLMDWVDKHGYEVVGPPEEIYLTGPDESEPAQLRTDVMYPVRHVQRS